MTSLTLLRRASRAARGSSCLLSAALLLGTGRAHAICRVVESETAPPVAFDATTSAFFVQLDSVVIDYTCPEDADAVRGLSSWGRRHLGDVVDRELPARDLAPYEARGEPLPAPASLDAGRPDGGGLVRVCADGTAATPVVSPLVSLVIQPRVLGGGGSSGLVMPVAARPDVALGPIDAFASLASISHAMNEEIHETVIVTEDASLGFQCTDPHYSAERETAPATEMLATLAAAPLAVYGCSASAEGGYYRPGTGSRGTSQVDYGDAGTVTYETIPVSDAYSVTALSASSLEALVAWMDEHGFAHDEVDDAAFSAYVGDGHWFVALDVHPPSDLDATELGVTGLAPLVVSWPGAEIPIQNRLQFDPEGGTLVTDAYVLSAHRVDAADGSALTMSAGHTTLPDSLASFGLSEGSLTRLRLARQQRDVLEDSRIVPIVGTAPPVPRTETERTTRVRVPLACCQGGGVASRSAPMRTFTYERTYTGAMPPIPEAWFHTPEHDLSTSFCQAASRSGGSGGSGGSLFCAAASAPVSGFGPIAFAVALLVLRARRRREAERRSPSE